MTNPPCGRASCPVADPTAERLRKLRSVVWSAGARLRRGHATAHPDPTVLVPGLGNTRFAPIDGVAHSYVASTSVAALLESAFHTAAPPAPRIPLASLGRWMESDVVLAQDVRLVDLRDPELGRLGIGRDELVATTPAHYPCTRRWATALNGRSIGGRTTSGLVWGSRQVEARSAALARRPAVRELMEVASSDVALIWAPPAPVGILAAGTGGLGPLDRGEGLDFVLDLAAALGIVIH
ncbi:MAG: RES domain-containing protein [Euzebya sp.]